MVIIRNKEQLSHAVFTCCVRHLVTEDRSVPLNRTILTAAFTVCHIPCTVNLHISITAAIYTQFSSENDPFRTAELHDTAGTGHRTKARYIISTRDTE